MKNPCDDCGTRRIFAKMFDMLFRGEDCPYECKEYEEYLEEGTKNMCKYQQENGKSPCCTHDCDGCVWNEPDEEWQIKKGASK